MGQSSAVLLLDDGELDDVQQIFERMGISYGRVRGEAIAPGMPSPSDLLVATPRRVDAVDGGAKPDPTRAGPVRVVVVNEDSNTLRARLREVGFDYLVRRPVHPEALRLLLLHCLYRGEERRREHRIPVGLDVSFRTGLLPRRATLIDLSTSGCRLLSPYALEPGMRIKVQVPRDAWIEEGLSLSGRILRIHLDEQLDGDGLYSTAVVFEKLSTGTREELARVIRDGTNSRIAESTDLEGDDPAGARGGEPPDENTEERRALEVDVRMAPSFGAPCDGSDASERRKARRASYPRKVPAFGDPALRVLVGRDLSSGGMRIERFPELAVGDRLHLAIYGDADAEPILIWSTVTRDDAGRGMALAFEAVDAAVAERLERLVASLPAVESLQGDEISAMGTVVSQVLAD